MASSIMEHLPSVYDPKSQGNLGSLRAQMDNDLSVFGEVVHMTGSMARVPGHGVHLDGVEVAVRHPGLRVPLRFAVDWNEHRQKMVYSNYDRSVSDPSDRFSAVLNATVQTGETTYATEMSDDAEVTRDVFARWQNNPAWRYASAEGTTRSQRVEWDDAAWTWNNNVHMSFTKGFATEREYGLFLSRLFSACQTAGVTKPSDFRMVKAGRKTRRGVNMMPTKMEDFSLQRVNLPEPHACRTPFVMFAAKLDGHPMADFLYDGNRLYSPWVSSGRFNLRVFAL